jgi:hypothetical protein
MFDSFISALIIIIIFLYLIYKPTASYRRQNYVDAEVQTLELQISTPHPPTARIERLDDDTFFRNASFSKSRRSKTTFRGHRN